MRWSVVFAAGFALIFCHAIPCSAEQIIIGENQGGWSLGIDYQPINALIGDELVFNYATGTHDVWRLPSTECNFTEPKAKLVGEANYKAGTGGAIIPLDAPGKIFFACSFIGHCDAGQILEVNVAEAGSDAEETIPKEGESSADGTKPATAAGGCSSPVESSPGVFTTNCRSPAVSLAPGDNLSPNILLPNPYPNPATTPQVVLKTIYAEIVDSAGTSIPLSEVYLHHIFGDIRFIPAGGSEIRRSPMQTALPLPYLFIVDTATVAPEDARYANFHVIRTTGVAAGDDLKACIECHCEGTDPVTGSMGCCKKCPTTSTDAAKDYYLAYNVTYSVPSSPIVESDTAKKVTPVVLDAHGGIEYSVAPIPPTTSGDSSTTIPPVYSFNRTFAFDFFCPQEKPFAVLRCVGHQHIGGRCINLTDAATGAMVCSSCPEYGTQPGVPGNEEGYLVGMGSALLTEKPFVVQPGQELTFSVEYNADQAYGGVMSLFAVMMIDFDAREECNVAYDGFVQPPNAIMESSRSSSSSSSAPQPAPQPSMQTAAEIIAGAKSKGSAIPAKCTTVLEYYTNSIEPCLPYLEDVLASNSSSGSSNSSNSTSGGVNGNTTSTTGSMGACCSAVENDSGGLPRIIDALATKQFETDCLCGLGELLLYAVRNDLVSPLLQLPDMCGGDSTLLQEVKPVGLYKEGFYVPINIYFKPNCPNIAAELDGSATNGGAAGLPPSSQDLSAAAPSPLTTSGTNIDAPGPSSSGGVKTHIPFNYLFIPLLWYVMGIFRAAS